MPKKPHSPPALRDVDYHVADWLKENRKSDNTADAYRRDLSAFLAHFGKPFKDAKPADVNAWRDTLTGEDATIARKVVSVRSFYAFCNSRGITAMILEQIKVPKITRRIAREKLLSRAEVKAMIQAAESDAEGYLFVRLIYTCGLRVSEALGLRWRDLVKTGNGKWTLREALVRGKGKRGATSPVPVPVDLWNDLQRHKGAAAESDHLFPGIQDRHAAARLVKRLAKAAKIEKEVSPHSFRHACVSHLLDKNVPLPAVRDLVRHANIATTDLYAHSKGTAGLGEMLARDDEEE